ncbi:bifunctional diaminohydroxyphosphoribosylaminopyrimidine deaminase/5-amino-6-(5-phosphoribosylamino)uracil reductase [compost metagenome]
MLEAGLVHKCVLFFAPKIIGGAGAPGTFDFAGYEKMGEAVVLDRMKVEQFGPDVCISGYPRYEPAPGNSP